MKSKKGYKKQKGLLSVGKWLKKYFNKNKSNGKPGSRNLNIDYFEESHKDYLEYGSASDFHYDCGDR